MKSQEISDVLTHEGIKSLKTGQVLMFNYEGSRNEYKITKLNKKSGRCWVVPIKTYHPDDVSVQTSVVETPIKVKKGKL